MSELQREESAQAAQREKAQGGGIFKAPDGVRRRTIVKSIAWSIPVIAASSAVAAEAASMNCAFESTTRIDAQAGSASSAQLPVTVPAGTRYLMFTVVGGDGGASTRAAAFGYGVSITGTIPVAALGGASTLQLVAGASGGYGNSYRGAAGGLGYGNGGHGGNGMGFGGGAGSALLLPDGTPLVVAGGGGGGSVHMTSGPAVADNSTMTRGNAALPSATAQDGFSNWRAASGGGALSIANGGSGATATAPGAGGTTAGYSTAAVSGVGGSGHNGGAGAGVPPEYIAETGVANSGAGGGGGGYLGGGGGATNYWTSGGRTLVASGGGGAGSFTASSVSTSETRVKVSTDQPDGFVQIEFYVCG